MSDTRLDIMGTRNHVLPLIIILSALVHGIFAADKDFLDDDIPKGNNRELCARGLIVIVFL